MVLKNVPYYYTGTPTQSCDSHSCQDTIISTPTQYSDLDGGTPSMNPTDPLDNLGGGDAMSGGIPPAPEDYEFTYPLVSQRSEEDLEGFGMNMLEMMRTKSNGEVF